MSSVLKYFKKKIQPFRKCVIASNLSPVFDQIESNGSFNKQAELELDSKTISKKSNSKRRFNLKLKRSIKSNLDEYLKQSISTSEEPQLQNETNEKQAEIDEDLKSKILFNSPVSSCNQTSFYSYLQSNTKTNSHFGLSSVDGEFFNSTNSNIDRNRASCSSYDPDCFIFESVSNASPANNTNTSMVTYNTKYANSHLSDDDGLISNSNSDSLIQQPSMSITSSIQQSTPYCESLARVRNLNVCKGNMIKKSQTTNFNSINKVEAECQISNETKTKCRRSNTTYTFNSEKPSSKIIDYFNNLESSKPLKRKANPRHQVEKDCDDESSLSKKIKADEFYSIYNDIEKLQDAFFHDDSSIMSSKNDVNESSSVLFSEKKNNDGLLNYLETITPPSSLTDSSGSQGMSSDLSTYSNETPEFKLKRANETVLINRSIEKVRRSLSMPGLIDHNSIGLANVSKISIIKENEGETVSDNLTKEEVAVTKTQKSYEAGINSNITETLVNSSMGCGEFVRGEPNTRLSKNIKQMFKNVIQQQMNALNNLEMFYESQVTRLEADRERSLEQNPCNKEQIHEYYSAQLKMLEERVQSNLKYLTENKSSKISTIQPKTPSLADNKENKQAKKVLTHKLSQLMLLKQLQQNQQQQVTSTVGRSRALVGLKASLINQNGLLPSKVLFPCNQSVKQTDLDESQQKDIMFKRNLSLPFKQCKNVASNINNAEQLIGGRTGRSPRMSSLAYSTSRIKYNKKLNSINATSSPLTIAQSQEEQKVTQFQYQKNVAKKFSTSTENISQYQKKSNQNDEPKLNKVEASTVILASKYAQIRRQNKSASSIKSENFSPLNEDEIRSSFDLNDESDKFQLSAYLRNNSIFCTNNNDHVVKYAAPRLSDGHIQFKIKMASKNEMKQNTQFLSNQLRISQNINPSFHSNFQLNEAKINGNKVSYSIETEV